MMSGREHAAVWRLAGRVLLCGLMLFGVMTMHAVPVAAGGHPVGTAVSQDAEPAPTPPAVVTAEHSTFDDHGTPDAHTMLHLCLAILAGILLLAGSLPLLRTRLRRHDEPVLGSQRAPRVREPPSWTRPSLHSLCVLRL